MVVKQSGQALKVEAVFAYIASPHFISLHISPPHSKFWPRSFQLPHPKTPENTLILSERFSKKLRHNCLITEWNKAIKRKNSDAHTRKTCKVIENSISWLVLRLSSIIRSETPKSLPILQQRIKVKAHLTSDRKNCRTRRSKQKKMKYTTRRQGTVPERQIQKTLFRLISLMILSLHMCKACGQVFPTEKDISGPSTK